MEGYITVCWLAAWFVVTFSQIFDPVRDSLLDSLDLESDQYWKFLCFMEGKMYGQGIIWVQTS